MFGFVTKKKKPELYPTCSHLFMYLEKCVEMIFRDGIFREHTNDCLLSLFRVNKIFGVDEEVIMKPYPNMCCNGSGKSKER